MARKRRRTEPVTEPAAPQRTAGEGFVSRVLLLLAPFVSGAAIMGLELVGLRLLAPRFGASTYVWGGLLGTIMAALAVGYLLGGALADRRPRPQWVFGLLLAGAAWMAADLVLTEAVLDTAERLGASLGPILATAILLAPPMLVLGSVSPFVVRLEGRLSSLGVTAGRVFALSTAGSLAGTFVASFWWIPDYGSRHTLRVFVAALVVLGFAGLAWPRWRAARAAAALLAAAAAFVLPDPPLPPGIVFAAESPYNTVFVEDQGGNKLLRLNDPKRGFHSVELGRGLLTGAYYDVLYLGPLLAGGRNVLVLGMGGGTTVRAYRRFYPGSRVTAVEIDPVIVQAAYLHMGLEPGPDLAVRVEDARPFLKRTQERFDVIEVDLFAGGPYAPFYCLTTEFFEAARARLAPSGLVSMNVYAPGGDRTLAEAVVATLARVFPTVLEVPLAEEEVLLAFREEVALDRVHSLLADPALPDELRQVAQQVAGVIRPGVPGRGLVLTDDRAPVEPLTHAMILRRDRLRAGGGD
jgi:Spermine/spermidine synthase domain